MPHPDTFQYVPQKGNGYVYHITIGRKHYVGISTTPFSKRWLRHKAPDSGCTKLVRELKRLKLTGEWDKINVQILQQAKDQQLDRLQKKYIKKYASYKSVFGLNSTPGGRDMTPAKMHVMKVFKKSRKKLKNPFSWDQI